MRRRRSSTLRSCAFLSIDLSFDKTCANGLRSGERGDGKTGHNANPVEAAALGHLARNNAPSEVEIELIDSTLKSTTRSLTDQPYMDLRVLLSGVVELPPRW